MTEKALNEHYERVHSTRQSVFPCKWPDCKYTTHVLSNLKNHMRAHKAKQECRHVCELCNYKAAEKYDLKRHKIWQVRFASK